MCSNRTIWVMFILACTLCLTLSAPAQAQGPGPATKPGRIKAVVWVGGFAHDFNGFGKLHSEQLPKALPIDLRIVRDGSFLDGDDAKGLDLIVMNHCFQTEDKVLSDAQKKKLLEMIRGGVGVVAVHASYYSFVKWDAIRELYGAKFTRHGKSDVTVSVTITDKDHPVTKGVENFEVVSELYESTPLAEGCKVLAVANEKGKDKQHPSVWTLMYGKGRVVCIMPAHFPKSYDIEAFQKVIANACGWASRTATPE